MRRRPRRGPKSGGSVAPQRGQPWALLAAAEVAFMAALYIYVPTLSDEVVTCMH